TSSRPTLPLPLISAHVQLVPLMSTRQLTKSWMSRPLRVVLRFMSPGSAQVGTTPGQNPPVNVNVPPDMTGGVWASGWPIVPERLHVPPALFIPPPPSTVDQVRSKPPVWARAMEAKIDKVQSAMARTANGE